MNLKQIRFARSVAEMRSFSKAAEACHVTQPTLSNAVSRFEEELGGRLFVRTTRRVAITPFGEHVLPLLRAVLDAQLELVAAARAYHDPEHKLLRIGFSPLIDMKLLGRVLEPYRQTHPEVNIFFKECFLDDLSERLGNEQIDFAVTPNRPENASRTRAFFYEETLFYLPSESRGDTFSATRIDELPDTPIILTGGGCGLNDALLELFNSQETKFHSYPGQALSYKIIEEWATLGIAAGILPRSKLSSTGGHAFPLQLSNKEPATFSYEWVWENNSSMKQHIVDFSEYVTATVPSLVGGDEALRQAGGQW